MKDSHPETDLLERFLRSETVGEERRQVVRHLLTGCLQCTAFTRKLWNLGESERRRPDLRRRQEARMLLQKGVIRGWSADPAAKDEAIRWLGEGLARLGPSGDPALAAFGFHRMALVLYEAGRLGAAEAAMGRARTLYEQQGGGPNRARLRHLEGRIAQSRGEVAKAEAAFLEARQAYLLAGLGGEAAEALMDLAISYARNERSPELNGLASELRPILRAAGVRQGVGFALLFFRRLVETGEATPDTLAEIGRYVASRPQEQRPALR